MTTGRPVLAYWQQEARYGCAVSLARLAAICAERGCDYDATVRAVGRAETMRDRNDER